MGKDLHSIADSGSGQLEKAADDLPLPCHSRKISLWLVLLDNIPTVILFILGFIIINQISTIGAIIFIMYALFSIVWFWAKICAYCHHYDTLACPCGYRWFWGSVYSGEIKAWICGYSNSELVTGNGKVVTD